MWINKDEITYLRDRFLARKRFVHDLYIMVVRGSFSVGVYKYARPGSLYDWIVVLKVTHGASYESKSAVEAIDDAAQQALTFLTRWENYDCVTYFRSQTSVNKKLASDILQVIIPDITHPAYADTTSSEKMLYSDIQNLIIQGDTFNDEDELRS